MLEWTTEPWEFGFMQRAFWAAILAGINCGVIGVYVVLRRMAFMGGALTHTILPGVVFAYLRGWSIFGGALVASLITALGVGWLSGRRSVREDTAIGVVLSGMFALGVLMMVHAQSFRDFGSLLFGSILGVSPTDLWLIAGVTLCNLVILTLFHKELELSSYDDDHSEIIGARPKLMRYLILTMVALSVVSAVQLLGALLTTALLITPAAAATLLGGGLKRMFCTSAAIASGSGITGLYLSFHLEKISSGAAIVLCCTAVFIVVWIARGLIGRD